MNDVKFEEENTFQQSLNKRPKHRTLFTRFLLRAGIIKDASKAQRVILIISIVFIVLAIALYYFTNSSEEEIVVDPYVEGSSVFVD